MGRTLKRTVITKGVTYARGTAETSELSELIPNPAAWEGEADPESEEPKPAPRKRAAKKAAAPKKADAEGASEKPAEEPPRGGEGATEDAWREYATGLSIEVPEAAGRDDIVALVDARQQQ